MLAVEPMVNVGKHQVNMADDKQSIFSAVRLARGSFPVHDRRTVAADGPVYPHSLAQ